MAPSLDPQRFRITEALPSDIEQIFRNLEISLSRDEMWKIGFKDVDPEVIHNHIMKHYAPRWLMNDMTIFKAVELKTGKIAGWSALQYPWSIRPISSEEEEEVRSRKFAPGPKGTNQEVYTLFFESISYTWESGYDPVTDFYRMGTMVLPEFQRRGIGTAFSKYWNTVAESLGARTFGAARPSSVNINKKQGYVTVGTFDAHLEKWGGSRENSMTYMIVKDTKLPQSGQGMFQLYWTNFLSTIASYVPLFK